MNWAAQPDTKSMLRNQRHFCTPTMDIRKTEIPFDAATRKRKYQGINLAKEVKYLYSEHYTSLKKEINEDTRNASMSHAHELEELTSSKWLYYPERCIDSCNPC